MKLTLKGVVAQKYLHNVETARDGVKALAFGKQPNQKFYFLINDLLADLDSKRKECASDLQMLLDVLDLDFVKKSKKVLSGQLAVEEAKAEIANKVLLYLASKKDDLFVREVSYIHKHQGLGGKVTVTKDFNDAIAFKDADIENFISVSFCGGDAPIQLVDAEDAFLALLICKFISK